MLAPINALRDDDELPPVVASIALDALAAKYLATMLEARCLCPVAGGEPGAERLLTDVRLAIGSDAALIDAGLIAGYDRTVSAAITTAIFDPANESAILGQRMTLVGVATAAVEAGRSWLAPPPGGSGPEIDLGSYTLVVIVVAGTGT